MEGPRGRMPTAGPRGGHDNPEPDPSRCARALAGVGIAGLWVVLATPARAQPPIPQVPEITERSGLVMRFAGTPEFLPPDPRRDNFYLTRYADKGPVTHPNWV